MDRLEQIFKRQLELTTEFHRIEVHNGLSDYDFGIPYDLSNPKAQKQLRATAWYIIEEMGEVLEAKTLDAQQKEVIDVFHFLVELMLCSGVVAEHIYPANDDKLEALFFHACNTGSDSTTLELVESLAWAMHGLKAKPWKQNPKETIMPYYKGKLVSAFFDFFNYAKSYDLTPDLLFNLYMGKAKINKERIASGA